MTHRTENSGRIFSLAKVRAAEPAADQDDDNSESDKKCDAMLVRKFFRPTVFNIADTPESAEPVTTARLT